MTFEMKQLKVHSKFRLRTVGIILPIDVKKKKKETILLIV